MSKKLESKSGAGRYPAKRLAITFAVWSALLMLILWVLANLGVYTTAYEQMANWHMFFDLTFTGLVAGMIEAAIVSYILVLVFAWVYDSVGEKY